MPFQVFETESRTILSPVSGFLAQAGYTHSLSPARNCTFGCSYCYVPTMRVQAGLKPEDWQHWGARTTFKTNAAELLAGALSAEQVIYCSPLTDPYQPAEERQQLMPAILEALARTPPRAFILQTRGPLILRDVELLRRIPRLRVSFSITTDSDSVRRIFEPHCASVEERFKAVEQLNSAGIPVSVALAPVLPCDPEALVKRALSVSSGPLVADPLHIRTAKRSGATTRAAALAICEKHGWENWVSHRFQSAVIQRMRNACTGTFRAFGTGPEGFRLLTLPVS